MQSIRITKTVIKNFERTGKNYLKIVLKWCATNDDAPSTRYLEQTFSPLSAWILYKMALKFCKNIKFKT